MPRIQITAKRDGFRRAGRAWSTTPTLIDADELSAGALEALEAETMLVIEHVNEGPDLGEVQNAIVAMRTEDPEKKSAGWWNKKGLPDATEISKRTGGKASVKLIAQAVAALDQA